MKKYDTIFLDRDGTLNHDPGYVNTLDDFAFFDFTLTAVPFPRTKGNFK